LSLSIQPSPLTPHPGVAPAVVGAAFARAAGRGRRREGGRHAERGERRKAPQLRPRDRRCPRGRTAPMAGGSKELASRPCGCGRRRTRATPLRPCSLFLCYPQIERPRYLDRWLAMGSTSRFNGLSAASVKLRRAATSVPAASTPLLRPPLRRRRACDCKCNQALWGFWWCWPHN
jgi:hypothetical protein